MLNKKAILLAIVIAALSSSSIANTSAGLISGSGTNYDKIGEIRIEIGFSPAGSAQKAILNLINSAKKEIRLSAYSFTSPEIVKALTQARHRGIDVKLLVDHKGNTEGNVKSSIAALNTIYNAGIPVRTIKKYAINHDKFIVVDRVSVETGSFNYSRAANTKNSENVIVLYNMPQVAEQYLKHWTSRWNDGVPWKSPY